MEHIQKIKSGILEFLQKSNPKMLVEVLALCSHKYYNTNEVLISDEEYDRIYEKLQEIDSENTYLKQVGAEVSGEKVD